MILKKEIQNKSAEWGVPPDIVDKDWVLGHFLSAMFSFEKFRFVQKTIFKGYDPESIEKIFSETNSKSVKNAWDNSIRHQIARSNFPDIEIVLSKVKNIIKKFIKK